MSDHLPAITPINNPKHRNMPDYRRCSAHKKTGERCQNPAILGGTVCPKHGGKAPQVVAKAKLVMQMASKDAAKFLVETFSNPNVPYSERLRAANSLMDRAGLSPQQAMQITHEVKPYEDLLATIHRGPRPRPGTGGEGGDAEPDDDVIDAEVVEDDDAPACRGCKRQFPATLPPHLSAYPVLCRDCRAEMENPTTEPEPRPSPSRYERRERRDLTVEPRQRVYDRSATPGAGEYGLMSDEEAARLAAQTRRRRYP